MSEFLHDDNNENADAKAIAIPRVFSENSQAKNAGNQQGEKSLFQQCLICHLQMLSVMSCPNLFPCDEGLKDCLGNLDTNVLSLHNRSIKHLSTVHANTDDIPTQSSVELPPLIVVQVSGGHVLHSMTPHSS